MKPTVVEYKQLLGTIERGSYGLDLMRSVGPRGECFQVATRGAKSFSQMTFNRAACASLRAALDAFDALNEEDAK